MIPIIGDIIKEVGDLASEFIVDKDKKIEFAFKMAELEDQAQARADALLQGQIEVNKVEAASGSLFVAGWRPFIGWVSGFGVAWTFVLSPMVEWISKLFGWTGTMPELDTGQLMTLILAMLGIGAQRTVEKIKGVSTNNYTDVPKIEGTKKESPAIEPDPPKKKHFHIF